METEEIINHLSENEEAKTQILSNFASVDYFKNRVNVDEELKKFLDSEKDTHFNKALSTWKVNNLNKEVEKTLFEKYPDLDPSKKEMLDLKRKVEDMEKSNQIKELKLKATQLLSEKNINHPGAIEFIPGDEEQLEKYLNFLTDLVATSMSKGQEVYKNIYKSEGQETPLEISEHLKRGNTKASIGEKINQLHNKY